MNDDAVGSNSHSGSISLSDFSDSELVTNVTTLFAVAFSSIAASQFLQGLNVLFFSIYCLVPFFVNKTFTKHFSPIADLYGNSHFSDVILKLHAVLSNAFGFVRFHKREGIMFLYLP